MKRTIAFSPPDMSEEEIQGVTEVIRSGWITTGSKTKQFEREIAAYCGTKKAVCLSSATASLEMTLRILGVGKGDEVITSAYTYTATCSPILHVGATPVLVDTAGDILEMDYDKMEKAITNRTKVIIPVDIAGIMCDYSRIFEAVEHKAALFLPANNLQEALGRIAVIADGAHSFGSVKRGLRSGAVADFTTFSFHAVKNLTTAEGGAVTWKEIPGVDNEALYRKYQLISQHGQSKDAMEKTQLGAWEYDVLGTWYKCNMTDISASIGLAQLKRYEENLEKRKRYIEIYNEGLKGLNISVLEHFTSGYKANGHLYMCRLNGMSRLERDQFIVNLAERGITANVHFKPLPMFTAYRELGFCIKDFPNAEAYFENEITLPLNTKMTKEDIRYVIEMFREVYEGCSV